MNTHARDFAARALPQMAGGLFLTDAGLETELVFHDGLDLPCFAAFPLATRPRGRARLREYYESFLELAQVRGAGFILEAPTWRASMDWGFKMGLSADEIESANRDAIGLLAEIRHGRKSPGPVVISGQIGPRGDGYAPNTRMRVEEAHEYHAHQIGIFSETEADMVTALTMTHAGEAAGVARAAQSAGIPCVISFTVETDGRLPSGQPLAEAVAETEEESGASPAYYMINCAHPSHFADVLRRDAVALRRLKGIRANASSCSHAELDEAEVLDDGDPETLGREYAALRRLAPQLNVFGGCCGTDLRHVRHIAEALAG